MLKLLSFSLFLCLLSNQSFAQVSTSYYGKKLNSMVRPGLASNGSGRPRPIGAMDSEELKDELYRVLTLNHIEKADQGFDSILNECPNAKCYRHTGNDYTNARGYIYNQLDIKTNSQGNSFVQDVYCKQIFNFRPSNFQNSRLPQTAGVVRFNQPSGDINIEHTWPKSKFSKEFSVNIQKGDLHHLFPSNGTMNGIRSSYPFGEVTKVDSSIPRCASVLGFDKNGDLVFESVDDHKGDVARAIFYFSIRYRSAVNKNEEEVLKRWNVEDPIDQKEITRNNDIFNIQHNRNPFIDYPELVNLISDF